MKIQTFVIGGICIIIIFLYFNEDSIKTDLDETDKIYTHYKTEIKLLQKENLLLKEQLLTRESLTFISKESAKRGFVKAQIIYLFP